MKKSLEAQISYKFYEELYIKGYSHREAFDLSKVVEQKVKDFKAEILKEVDGLRNMPKIGSVFYGIRDGQVAEYKLFEIRIKETGPYELRLYSAEGRLCIWSYDYFKKNTFLTREAAEEALMN